MVDEDEVVSVDNLLQRVGEESFTPNLSCELQLRGGEIDVRGENVRAKPR